MIAVFSDWIVGCSWSCLKLFNKLNLSALSVLQIECRLQLRKGSKKGLGEEGMLCCDSCCDSEKDWGCPEIASSVQVSFTQCKKIPTQLFHDDWLQVGQREQRTWSGSIIFEGGTKMTKGLRVGKIRQRLLEHFWWAMTSLLGKVFRLFETRSRNTNVSHRLCSVDKKDQEQWAWKREN